MWCVWGSAGPGRGSSALFARAAAPLQPNGHTARGDWSIPLASSPGRRRTLGGIQHLQKCVIWYDLVTIARIWYIYFETWINQNNLGLNRIAYRRTSAYERIGSVAWSCVPVSVITQWKACWVTTWKKNVGKKGQENEHTTQRTNRWTLKETLSGGLKGPSMSKVRPLGKSLVHSNIQHVH